MPADDELGHASPCPLALPAVAVCGRPRAAAAGHYHQTLGLYRFPAARRQHVVDRRFNRARYDAEHTVTAFAARLQDAVDPDVVRADLAGVVQVALEPTHVSVWLGQ